jgi:hypothetical protein
MSHTTLTCPECQTTLKPNKPVPAGTRLKCPKCQTPFFAPPAALPEEPPAAEALEEAPGQMEELDALEELQELEELPAAGAAVTETPIPTGRRLDDDDRPSRRRGRGRDDDEEDRDGRGPRRGRGGKKGGVPVWVWLALGGGGLVVLLLCGVGGIMAVMMFGNRVTMANYDRIKTGMTETEVKAIMGEPTKTSTMFFKILIWENGNDVIEVVFDNNDKVSITVCRIGGVEKGNWGGLK